MVVRQVVVVVLLILCGAYARELAHNRPAAGGQPDLAQIEREPSGWRCQELPIEPGIGEALNAGATAKRIYRRGDGAEVVVFVAYFPQQEVNSQIHSPRNCLPGEGWAVESLERVRMPAGTGGRSQIRMVVSRNLSRQEVRYWFQTRGGTLASEYALKWDLVKNALARRPTDAVFVRYSAAHSDSSALLDLMARLNPSIDRVLGEVGLQ